MAQGPQFVQYFGPVLEVLRDLGGEGTPEKVRDQVASKLMLGEDVRAEKTKSGQSRFENQIAWARFYLVKGDLIDPSRRGVWSLTEKGKTTHLDEDGALALFREVHAGFKAPTDEDGGPEQHQASGAVEPSIEGFDESHDLTNYPIDSVLIRSEQRTVHDVVRRIRQGIYVLDPDFQREFLWDPERQSRLIESVLMRIPLPVFYLAEDPDGKLVVVDGLQRLTTFKKYLADELRLKLENPDLNGKIFSELPAKLQNRIEDAQLIIYFIDSKVPERARLDIFERVNSGVPLTRQQMRNSLYQGKATALIRELSEDERFLDATKRGLDRKTMRDREAINRFCAFHVLGVEKYEDEMDDFLAKALRFINRLSDAGVASIKGLFLQSMSNNAIVFGEHAFRRHQRDQARRSVINMSLFDVASVCFARYPEELVTQRAEALREGFFRLMSDRQFIEAISLGTSDRARVLTRFATFNEMIVRVLGAPGN
jgi:Mrr N-terminal domain/Protein of unknown function DUF262